LSKGADPNIRSSIGTPLHYALSGSSQSSNTEIQAVVVEMLEHGADINAIGTAGTVLHIVLQIKPSKSQLSLMAEVLKRGADVNVVCRLPDDLTFSCSPG